MPQIRTFIDSSVLISAFRGQGDLGENALAVLDEQNRDFVTSDFVRLEVLPKPICHKRQDEIQFYETFFDAVDDKKSAGETIHSSRNLVQVAQREAEKYGLSAVDALHVAAAQSAGCHELITAEKSTKPFFNVTGVTVRSIRP